MALLLGPPSSGKTTLLLALAGKLSKGEDNIISASFFLEFSILIWLGDKLYRLCSKEIK